METPACSKAQPALNSLRWIHYRGVIREGTQWFPHSLLQYTGELLKTKLTDLKSGLLFFKPISSLCLLSVCRSSWYWDVKCHQTNDNHQSKTWSTILAKNQFVSLKLLQSANSLKSANPLKQTRFAVLTNSQQALPCWPYEGMQSQKH